MNDRHVISLVSFLNSIQDITLHGINYRYISGTVLFISEILRHETALDLIGDLYFRYIFLRICEDKRDLNHILCFCKNVLFSWETDMSNVFSNLHVIKDIIEVVFAYIVNKVVQCGMRAQKVKFAVCLIWK